VLTSYAHIQRAMIACSLLDCNWNLELVCHRGPSMIAGIGLRHPWATSFQRSAGEYRKSGFWQFPREFPTQMIEQHHRLTNCKFSSSHTTGLVRWMVALRLALPLSCLWCSLSFSKVLQLASKRQRKWHCAAVFVETGRDGLRCSNMERTTRLLVTP
jgi:hypothetical protein